MTTAMREVELKSFDINYWIKRWNEENTPWHEVTLNPFLEKYVGLLEGGRQNLKIIVPLCGKSVDMAWLAGRGHYVFGVDASPLAVKSFFEENSLQYTTDILNSIPIYKDISGHITIYNCNFFDFDRTGEGAFDAIWDRGGLGAVNPADRKRYVQLISSLTKPEVRHLLELFVYDDTIYQGSPFRFSFSMVQELFGDEYSCELLESGEAPDIGRKVSDQFKSFIRNMIFITRK